MISFEVSTQERSQMIDITGEVEKRLGDSPGNTGGCLVFVPHTTAAVTINERADPAVRGDILNGLETMVPWRDDYQHMEGNSAAHIKSSLIGSSEYLAVERGKLILGTWQTLFLCEFDGPRRRKVYVKLITD